MKKLFFKSIFEKFKNGGFKVTYWDGEELAYGDAEPKFKIIFNKPPAVNFNPDDPYLAIGEAYMDEIIDFEGSFDEAFRILELNKESFAQSNFGSKLSLALKTLNHHDNWKKQKQKENIKHHYDLGNDFFSLWLDETMSYSCAYFNDLEDPLDKAQLQKIDYILKKLQLQADERLLDIGSGWGWLIIRAAQQYRVEALGITLSEEQYKITKERIKRLGLAGQVEVKLINYLELDEKVHKFDKIVSVGMFEHVGKDNLPTYMDKIKKLLAQGGLSMLHTITRETEGEINSWMKKYIFPGAYVPSLREIIWLLPEYDFYLLHAESLRMHYAITLDKWHENFSRQLDLIEGKFGRRFVRMWDLYLRGCAASFRVAGLNIHQLLFSKGYNNSLSLTWDYLNKK